VFGTLTVPAVIAAGPTAIAEAAKPTLGQFGFVLMGVTALFSTTGATNAGLYPATGLSEQLAADGQFPPIMGRRIGGRANFGLLTQAALILVMVASFDLSAIASIGSAVALMIFVLITVGHFRVRSDTGASAFVLGLALLTAAVSLITFVVTDLIHELAAIWTLVGIVVLSIVLDQWWSRKRDRAAPAPA
jgi:amino acid transporter